MKSIDISEWRPVLDCPGVQFVSLQYGDVSEDLRIAREVFGVEIFQDAEIDSFNDLDGLVAQMHALDLVISVSNTTAHLAASTNVPIWVILPQHLLWYWGFQEERTDWYPNARLFRFKEMCKCSPDMLEVASTLKKAFV